MIGQTPSPAPSLTSARLAAPKSQPTEAVFLRRRLPTPAHVDKYLPELARMAT
jgi:hypothetical protein